MKCVICGCLITEDNMLDEDTIDFIHGKVDMYGMSCLTENEQTFADAGLCVCSECIQS